tara:strand:- start:452 stop:1438 length:987 start_codon:yes stop_codon:yes gene_type:complete
MKNKILIVGGHGYIGSILLPFFAKKNFKVTSLDNLIYNQKRKVKDKKNKINFIKFDFRKKNLCYNLVKNNDTIIFLAGLVGDPITKKYPVISKSINRFGITKFIDIIKKFENKHFIFVSTCSNYGIIKKNLKAKESHKLFPLSSYAKDKVFIEKYIQKNLFKSKNFSTILRFATAFGYSERMRYDLTINQFVKTLFFKKKLEVYDQDTFRPYCHVKDFANIIFKVIQSKKIKTNNQIFNCGDNKNNFSKLSIAKKISRYFNYPNIQYRDLPSNDRRNYQVNFHKLNKKLRYKCKYNLDYGIKEMIYHLKKNKKHKNLKLGNYKINISK